MLTISYFFILLSPTGLYSELRNNDIGKIALLGLEEQLWIFTANKTKEGDGFSDWGCTNAEGCHQEHKNELSVSELADSRNPCSD
ncbi:hypothetical protein [Brucella thiophenivorans]|uniref:hypothetical protein n=1 Tax=Brucella thiophenivorans TaxID=571255 RepID=UPI00146A6A25|nr:hypothetical protein [Brucella thiophenivorans]